MSLPKDSALLLERPRWRRAHVSEAKGMRTCSMALLVLSSCKHLPPFLRNLESLDLEVLAVESFREARELLQTYPRVKVVIADVTLSDGNWCDILKYIVDSGIQASVVVRTRLADENLWSEVLWRGAYDLLVEPLESVEVTRIVEGALRAVESSELGREETLAASAG